MNKVVFIMENPNCCGECPMSGTGVCRKWNMKDLKTFSKDCPLKEAPKKLSPEECDKYAGHGCFSRNDFSDGYNMCIDKIL